MDKEEGEGRSDCCFSCRHAMAVGIVLLGQMRTGLNCKGDEGTFGVGRSVYISFNNIRDGD